MAVSALFVIALEMIGMAAAGYIVGKTVHLLLRLILNKIAKRTETKLDDFILEELDKPLEIIAAFVVIYELSRHLENLVALREVISKYALSIIIFLSAYTAAEVFGAFLRWYYLEGREQRHLKNIKVDISLLPFLRKLSKLVIVSIGLTVALSFLGINVTGFFALASVVGVIIGLASQETLANIFAGLALQLDRPFLYGEYLKFSTGEVARLVKIGLRSTRLEDLNGNIIIISNSELAKQKITNLSRPTDEFGSSVVAELPNDANLDAFEDFMTVRLAKSTIPGLKKDKMKIYIERVADTGTTVAIAFGVTAHPHLADARDFFNRTVLEFLRKKKS
ncbi:MAG: mechanosensitive ion channel family protein [archaeon]